MPYIPQKRRVELDTNPMPFDSSELTYLITKLIAHYAQRYGVNDYTIGTISGALASAHDEFYRRVATPYQTRRCSAHGDIYEGLE